MKKFLFSVAVSVFVLALSIGAQAYLINDPSNDGLGSDEGYESFGIDVFNFPGDSGNGWIFNLYTDYPYDGILTGTWQTEPADLFIDLTYGDGSTYYGAIPLKSHGSFIAGTFYQVTSVQTSDDLAPSGGYVYTPGAPVWIEAGQQVLGNTGTVNWISTGGDHPEWQVQILAGVYDNDATASMSLYWGTATCGNDPVQSPVPEPTTMLLMGGGLLGLLGYSRRRFNKKS